MSEDKESIIDNHIHSLEAEFWALKTKAREEADTWKKSLMYSKRAIGAGLSLTDYKMHQAFRDTIGQRMNKLDADLSEGANWIDKGWGFVDWQEASAENHLDDFHIILADVQAFLVKEGIILAREESLEKIIKAELIAALITDLGAKDDGREG